MNTDRACTELRCCTFGTCSIGSCDRKVGMSTTAEEEASWHVDNLEWMRVRWDTDVLEILLVGALSAPLASPSDRIQVQVHL